MKVFSYDFKRNLKKIYSYFFVFLGLSIVFTQIGITKINSIYNEEERFKDIESQLVKRYVNFHQYGGYGIRLKKSPTAIAAIFAESSPFLSINAFIDIGVRLYLYQEISSDNAIDKKGYLDMHWILAVIGTLLVSVWGWNTWSDKKLLKFVFSIHKKRVKREIILSRITLIFLGIVIIYGQIMLQFFINRCTVNAIYLGLYLIIVLLIYLIWFWLASLLGDGKKNKRKILFAVIWIFFVLIIQEGAKQYFSVESKVTITCKYNHELKKIEILMRFEREAADKAKNLTKEQRFSANVRSSEQYWEIESKELEKLEKELVRSLEKLTKKYQFICALTPMTFLKSVGWEISSQGFNEHIKFHQLVIKTQRKFLRYIFDNMYVKGLNEGPLTPFLKEGDNIFLSKSTLPAFFGLGLIMIIIQIIILLWLNWRKFENVIFSNEPVPGTINEHELIISEGEKNILITASEPHKQNLFNHFIGKFDLKGTVTIKTSKEIKRDYIYLFPKKEIESMFSQNEISKLIGERLNKKENWELIFQHAQKEGKVLILDDFLEGLSDKEILKVVEIIKREKLIALIITNNKRLACWLEKADKIQIIPGDDSITF